MSLATPQQACHLQHHDTCSTGCCHGTTQAQGHKQPMTKSTIPMAFPHLYSSRAFELKTTWGRGAPLLLHHHVQASSGLTLSFLCQPDAGPQTQLTHSKSSQSQSAAGYSKQDISPVLYPSATGASRQQCSCTPTQSTFVSKAPKQSQHTCQLAGPYKSSRTACKTDAGMCTSPWWENILSGIITDHKHVGTACTAVGRCSSCMQLDLWQQ